MNLIKHKNNYYWGTVIHLIKDDGKAHIACQIEDDEYVFICELFILEELRGKGLGKELLKEAEQIGKDYNKTTALLKVEKIDKLVDYYKEAGYEQYDEDEHYIYMKKEL